MRRLLCLLALFAASCDKDKLSWSPRDAGGPAAPAASVPAPAPAPPPKPQPSEPRADEAPAPRDAGAGPAFEGSAGITEKKRPLPRPVVMTGVRVARHPGFDRLVLEFGKALPGYHVEYVDRPIRSCGSGDTIPMEGDGWLRVRVEPVQAHTEMGDETISGPDRHRKLELGVLRELVMTCDFEGQVEWVLGVSSPNKYRVLELSSPPRLVVDVLH